jgi:hypothetical protein
MYSNGEKSFTVMIDRLRLPLVLCYQPNTRVVAPLRLPSALESGRSPEYLQNHSV